MMLFTYILATFFTVQMFVFKVEYLADAEYESSLKHSKKNSMYWSMVTLSNTGKNGTLLC